MSEKKKQEIPVPFNLDDLFSSQEQRDEEVKEHIEEIDISLIDNFKNHPFKVENNAELKSLKESINSSGVLSPVIIREKNGRYEMISGHRRKYACQLLGMKTIPCIIKNLSDDEAIIFMVDSNLQREKLLPSEKAFAYKMKMDAITHQGKTLSQHGTTSCQVGTKFRSDNIIASTSDDSARQIQRYIRLTYLIPDLLEMVDNAERGESPSIAFSPAVELSFLKKDEQSDLVDAIECNDATPSLGQAIKLKELSQTNKLDFETMNNILEQIKPNQIVKFKIPESKLLNVLPQNLPVEKREAFVLKACEYYSKHLKQREVER